MSNCVHMVYLACAPEAPTTHSACSAYMTAALNTGNTMMFTHQFETGGKWDALKIATAKLMIKSNAGNFIKEHGAEWFFCKCRSDRVKECEKM